MSNNVENTSEEYDEDYYYDLLDLMGNTESVNGFLQIEGIHSFLPNILFSSEFKPLYKGTNNESSVTNDRQSLYLVNKDEEIKTSNLYFFELQYFLRDSYRILLENFIKNLGTEEIVRLNKFCYDSNQSSDNYIIFRVK